MKHTQFVCKLPPREIDVARKKLLPHCEKTNAENIPKTNYFKYKRTHQLTHSKREKKSNETHSQTRLNRFCFEFMSIEIEDMSKYL